MAESYESCPRCGRTNFGEIFHCARCGTEFCTYCTGKRRDSDGKEYKCCPRCGAELDDDDTIKVVAVEKKKKF